MPPKKDAADVGETFSIGSVQCRVQRGGLVKVGINQTGPGGTEPVVRMRQGELAKDAAVRKLKELADREKVDSASTAAASCDGASAHVEAGRAADGPTAAESMQLDAGCDQASVQPLSSHQPHRPQPPQPPQPAPSPPPLQSDDGADAAQDKAAAYADTQPMDEACEDEPELDELRRDLFAELGDAGVAAATAAAANDAEAAATTAAEAATRIATDTEAAATTTATSTATGAGQPPAKRARKTIVRLDPAIPERGGGGWGTYDLARIGQRHGRVREQPYEEVRAEARELRQQMDSLRELLGVPDRSFNALLERVAATVLFQAAAEEAGFEAAGSAADEAAGGEAADGAADGEAADEAAGSEAAGGEAAGEVAGEAAGSEVAGGETAGGEAAGGEMDDAAAADGAAAGGAAAGGAAAGGAAGWETVSFADAVCAGVDCAVEIRQRELRFVLPDGREPADKLPLVLPVQLVQGISTTDTAKVASCLLTISSEEQPLELCFPARNAFAAMGKQHSKARDCFVRTLEAARLAAASECAGAQPTPATTTAPGVQRTPATTPAPATSPRPATAAAPPPPMETSRARKGRELRELLRRVSKLHSAHKTKEAEAMLAAAAAGSGGSEPLTKKRAQQLRTELFTYGGLELTRGVLAQFFILPEVKLLLPEATRQAQQEVTDSKTARMLLQAASKFLHEVLHTKGRRSDEDRNAFWASVVSLLPHDLLDKRMGAAAMRLLKVRRPY